MPKIALDLYHGTSKKKSTSISLDELPQFNIRYYSDDPDNVYLCADTQWMKFITNYNYIVEVEVLNEPVGTVVSLNAFGRWYEGSLNELVESGGNNGTALTTNESKLNGAPLGLVNITPLSGGKIQANGRARFRVMFKNRANQHLNGFRCYNTAFEVSTSRGVSRSLNTYDVSYNPDKSTLVKNYTHRPVDLLMAPDFIDVPVNDYGCSVVLVVVGAGGGASTTYGRQGDTGEILPDCAGQSPGGSNTSLFGPNNFAPGFFYYRKSHTNYISDLGYGATWPNRSSGADQRYHPYVLTAGCGGGGDKGLEHMIYDRYLIWGIDFGYTVGSFEAKAPDEYVPDNTMGGIRSHVDIKIELLESSSGEYGTYAYGGASVHTNGWWQGTTQWGKGGNPSQLSGYIAESVGGGSGAYAKIRVTVRRKASAKNMPLPPLTMGFGENLKNPQMDGGKGGASGWFNSMRWVLANPTTGTITSWQGGLIQPFAGETATLKWRLATAAEGLTASNKWNTRYGANPKPGKGNDGCCGIVSVTNFNSFA